MIATDMKPYVAGVIVEEVSTLSPQMISLMDRHLWQVVVDESEPFGGLLILFVGDMGQLGPVRATPISVGTIDLLKEERDEEHCRSLHGRFRKVSFHNMVRCRPEKEQYREGHPYHEGVGQMTQAKLFELSAQQRVKNDQKY